MRPQLKGRGGLLSGAKAWRSLTLGALLISALLLASISLALGSPAASPHRRSSLTRQINRCKKRFSGKSKKQHKARHRCIAKARRAARRRNREAEHTAPGVSPAPSPGSAVEPESPLGPPGLELTTTELHKGVAGLSYVDQLSAAGGTAPYSFSVTGLPEGLESDSGGLITGSPGAIGISQLQVEVADAGGEHAEGTVELDVPSTLPPDCMQEECSHLTPDGETVQIDGSEVTGISRNPDTQQVTSLNLIGSAPEPQQIIVVSPTTELPSGLAALVLAATSTGEGETSLTVQPATLGDAFASGTVQAIGSSGAESLDTLGPQASPPAASAGGRGKALRPVVRGAGSLSCDSGVSSDLHGLGIKPSLTPTMAAIWHHPLFGGGGFYPGVGGLELFQFDLDGDIEVAMGISVSGKATCTLHLPSVVVVIPAGELGAVLIETSPVLTLKAAGKVNVRTSMTLSCGAEYRWDEGHEYRGSYCAHRYQPLRLAADNGVDVSASGMLETTVSLDDIAGVDGSIGPTLHAGYHPADHPVAELDASIDYDLGACLACFWKGSPTRVTIAHGTLFSKTLATYDTAPEPPVDSDIHLEGLDFGTLPAGQETVEHISANGGTPPYTYAVSPGSPNEANVPSWVHVEPDGTVKIDPPDATDQSVSFYVYGTDALGQESPLERDQVTFTVDKSAGEYANAPWKPSAAPRPTDAVYPADISAAACTGTSNLCVAVGEYTSKIDGEWHALIETYTNGQWSANLAPLPNQAAMNKGSILTKVSCAHQMFCVALGWYIDNEGSDHSFVDTLSNGTWTGETLPLPTDAGQEQDAAVRGFRSVSCSGEHFCVVAGGYEDESYFHYPVVDTVTDDAWSSIKVPVPLGGTGAGDLSSVSCTSEASCVAVGSYEGWGGETLIETLKNGTWTPTTAPLPPDVSVYAVGLRSVSCSQSHYCVAIGEGFGSGAYSLNLIETLDGGSWEPSVAPEPVDNEPESHGLLNSVSCGASICAVVGNYFSSHSPYPMVDRLHEGSTWTSFPAPLPADVKLSPNRHTPPEEAELRWVTCGATGVCVAVGWYPANDGTTRPLIETSDGESWLPASPSLPSDAQASKTYTASMSFVTCSTSGDLCVAGGEYEAMGGEISTLMEVREPAR